MSGASPSSPAQMSDLEPPSSPALHAEKSFMTVVTEDEDNTKMATATPEPSEKHPRGKKRGRGDDAATSNGTVVGKIRHLKKEDGEPLWRKDIQYDFLKAVFDNEAKVFTNSYEPEKIGKQCFADLYIDTMSRSSKTSKVLRDKLLSDRDAAKGMAMVCLLVNIGRMNTTLNFFPEMRAQLRTYHAIPSLQARQDPHAYKQLQDAPRLKSILKGGAEDRREPGSLEDLKSAEVPRTNPVNLLFVICQAAVKVAELHFPPGREFHDLIMKTNYTSESRALAFLWIMWFYLESDFTEEGCEENPFGAGVDYNVDVANQGVPRLVEMTRVEENSENVDPEEEIEFGYAKQKMRAKIIEADQQFLIETQSKRVGRVPGRVPPTEELAATTGILPRIRPSKHESDLDSVRSTPPPRVLIGRQSGALTGTGRRAAPLRNQWEGSSPGGGQLVEGVTLARKPRPPTAHQIAVERNRSQRVEYILDRGIRKSHHKSRKLRRQDGSIIRALNRLKRLAQVQDSFEDSEDEECVKHNALLALSHGPLGAPAPPQSDDALKAHDPLLPFREKGYGGLCQLRDEADDYGEEFSAFCAALRRSHRRLTRWENYSGPGELGVVAPTKRPKPANTNGDDAAANQDHQNGNGGGADDDDMTMMMMDETSMMMGGIDPAETEDETEVLMARSTAKQRRQQTSKTGRGAKTNGVRRRRVVDMNGDTHMDDAEDLDDVEKDLLGLGDGEGEAEAEGEGEAENEAEVDLDNDAEENGEEGDDGDGEDGEEGEENEEDLNEVEKTLLGMDGDSDSE
ncbi:hypothetical protein B0H63DRAFT_248670 [Podospora didyma]|uniref:Ino eighty subunit 1 n=1 Tax=Podospora didyma TaxID=330526 RepID=A0AAE0KLP6_9PEZI|nr:hypothetical protein B0H63DRAFT_248670 [Podospora didyma]